eukprot:CAMPEP_0174258204 /NCGR_PEP_ID=MMETSP0439-20130205/7244_1 /TAXON_ID=0 /ORGANISM="Stereomyxa ramosa, Strain Chinc5" /LENGTH=551 /DNA_ID=CAMNT_0015341627 /DNA_START=65 /DNA_END=1720 /DNA_ORIENTATION=+
MSFWQYSSATPYYSGDHQKLEVAGNNKWASTLKKKGPQRRMSEGTIPGGSRLNAAAAAYYSPTSLSRSLSSSYSENHYPYTLTKSSSYPDLTHDSYSSVPLFNFEPKTEDSDDELIFKDEEESYETYESNQNKPNGDISFWSSYSVVESLFSDELQNLRLTKDQKKRLEQDSESDDRLYTHDNICCTTDLTDHLENEGSLLLELPSNILLLIFAKLNARDLINLELVCKSRLSVLARDDGLWKEIYLKRWKLLENIHPKEPEVEEKETNVWAKREKREEEDREAQNSDEWAWIYSLLQQNERWKDIFQIRYSAERWRVGTLKMFNGCWGFISQQNLSNCSSLADQPLDIFFHRKDIDPEGDWFEDWWLKDTPGVSRSQKCGYWDTFLCGRVVRYKQRAAYAARKKATSMQHKLRRRRKKGPKRGITSKKPKQREPDDPNAIPDAGGAFAQSSGVQGGEKRAHSNRRGGRVPPRGGRRVPPSLTPSRPGPRAPLPDPGPPPPVARLPPQLFQGGPALNVKHQRSPNEARYLRHHHLSGLSGVPIQTSISPYV